MRTIFSKLMLTAALALAVGFTASCGKKKSASPSTAPAQAEAAAPSALTDSCEGESLQANTLHISVDENAISVNKKEIVKTTVIYEQDSLQIEALEKELNSPDIKNSSAAMIQADQNARYDAVYKIISTLEASNIKNINVAAHANGKAYIEKLDSLRTEPSESNDNSLNLTVAIARDYLEIWARGGSLPKIFFKEMWTFRCKSDNDTITYDPNTISEINPPKCQNGSNLDGKNYKHSIETINLWTLHKESEEDPGTMQMSVYSKSDSAYLDASNNEFIASFSGSNPGSVVATLAESSARRKLTCGQTAPGMEDICEDGRLAITLKPRSAYDELAKTLIMIHNRFIDSPDANKIIISAYDDAQFSKVIQAMQRARTAGFTDIKLEKSKSFAKDIDKAYSLMKDKNFAKDIDKVLKNVAGLQTSGNIELGGRRGSAANGSNDGYAEGSSGKAKGSIIKAPSVRDIDMGSDGARSKQEILQVVNARMPSIKNIYNKYLKLKPGFSGKVTLKFTIAPGGDIVSINIVSSTTGYPDFDNAVKNMVATWKWKVIKSGNATPTIPFNFAE